MYFFRPMIIFMFMLFSSNLLADAPTCTDLKDEYKKISENYFDLKSEGKSLKDLQKEHDEMMAKYVAVCGIRAQINEMVEKAKLLKSQRNNSPEHIKKFLDEMVPLYVFHQSFAVDRNQNWADYSIWKDPKAKEFRESIANGDAENFKNKLLSYCGADENKTHQVCIATTVVEEKNSVAWKNLQSRFQEFSQSMDDEHLLSAANEVRDTYYKEEVIGFDNLEKEKLYQTDFNFVFSSILKLKNKKTLVSDDIKRLDYNLDLLGKEYGRHIQESNAANLTNYARNKFYNDYSENVKRLRDDFSVIDDKTPLVSVSKSDMLSRFKTSSKKAIDDSLKLLNPDNVQFPDGSSSLGLQNALTSIKATLDIEGENNVVNQCLDGAGDLNNCLTLKLDLKNKLNLGSLSLEDYIQNKSAELKKMKDKIEGLLNKTSNKNIVTLYNYAQYQLKKNCLDDFKTQKVEVNYACNVNGLSGDEKVTTFFNQATNVYEHVRADLAAQNLLQTLGHDNILKACAKYPEASKMCALLPSAPPRPNQPGTSTNNPPVTAQTTRDSTVGTPRLQTHTAGARASNAVAPATNGAHEFAMDISALSSGFLPATVETIKVNQSTVGYQYQKMYYDKLYEYRDNLKPTPIYYYYYPYNQSQWGVGSYNPNYATSFNFGNSSIYSSSAVGSQKITFPEVSYFNSPGYQL